MIIPRLIRKLFTIYHKCKIKSAIYLTFDDGPDDKHTPNLLKLLAKHKIKVTFFVNGNRLLAFPDIAKSIVADGHVLANHTFSHKILPKCSKQEKVFEISECQKVIDSLQCNNERWFRPPQGLIGITEIIFLVRNKYRVLLWTLDSKDSFESDHHKIIDRLKTDLSKSEILLLHDDSSTCISVLEEMIPYWKSKGYHFTCPKN